MPFSAWETGAVQGAPLLQGELYRVSRHIAKQRILSPKIGRLNMGTLHVSLDTGEHLK